MLEAFTRAWQNHRLMTIGFIVLCAVTFLLTLRLVFSIIYWQNHANMPIEPWMRLGYISRSYQVSVESLRTAIDLPADQRERRPISEIAIDRGMDVSKVVEILKKRIAADKAGSDMPGSEN